MLFETSFRAMEEELQARNSKKNLGSSLADSESHRYDNGIQNMKVSVSQESEETGRFMLHHFKNVKQISQQALLLEHRSNDCKNIPIELSIDD